jgi:hypothetical protein
MLQNLEEEILRTSRRIAPDRSWNAREHHLLA